MKSRVFPIFAVILSILLFGSLANAQTSVVEMESDVPNAVAVRIPNTGFDFATDLAETLINAIDLNAFIMAMNPVYPEECLTVASVGVNITQSHIGAITMDISSAPLMGMGTHQDDLYIQLNIAKQPAFNNIFEFNAFGSVACFWPDYSVTASIDVTGIQVGVAVGFLYSPQGGLSLAIDEIKVNLVDFAFDINNFPDTIEDWFAGEIEGIFEDIVGELGVELIQDVLDDQLGNINLSGDSNFSGHNLHYELNPRLFTNPTGATFFSDMQLFLSGTTVDACVDPGWPIGSRLTNNNFGPFGDLTPNGNTFQLGVGLSDDIFNQLLFSIYAKGMLCWGPEGLSKGKKMRGYDFENLLRGTLPKAELDKIKSGEWLFSIYPVNPPLIEVGDSGNDLALLIDDMRFDWLVQREGRFVELLNASFDINIGLDIEMDINSNLIITFNQPNIELSIHESSYNILPIEIIEPLLNTLIGFVQTMLEDLIPPIPVPGFAGFSLIIEEIAPIGTYYDYLGLFLSIESPLKIAAFGEPETNIILFADNETIRGNNILLDNAKSAQFGLNDGRSITIGLEALGKGEINKFYYKVDNSGWRLVKGNEATITNLIEGQHTLYVKAKNSVNVEDPSPALVTFVCDNIAPEITGVEQAENLINVDAWDYTDQNLIYVYKIDDGAYMVKANSPSLSLEGLSNGRHKIEVNVMDSAQNISQTTTLYVNVEKDSNSGSDNQDGLGSGADGGSGSMEQRNSDDFSNGGCGIGSEKSSPGNVILALLLLSSFLVIRLLGKAMIVIKR